MLPCCQCGLVLALCCGRSQGELFDCGPLQVSAGCTCAPLMVVVVTRELAECLLVQVNAARNCLTLSLVLLD